MPAPLTKGRAWWMGHRGNGLRVRLKRIPGETDRRTLPNPLRFPAIMRGFGWSEEFARAKFRTLRRGEFSQKIPGRSLRVLEESEVLTLAYDPEWLTVRGIRPRDVHETLVRIGRSGDPVQLMAKMEGSSHPLLRAKVNLLGMSVVMKEGEPDSLYYMVNFEEWRGEGLTTERRSKGRFPLNHYLDANDTLHSLAQRYYRTNVVSGWRQIALRNNVKGWGPSTPLVDTKRFKVGDKFVIPEPKSVGGEFGESRGSIGPVATVRTPAKGFGDIVDSS